MVTRGDSTRHVEEGRTHVGIRHRKPALWDPPRVEAQGPERHPHLGPWLPDSWRGGAQGIL